MADSLPALLLASLGPSTRKEAEQKLLAFSDQPNFLPSILQPVLDDSQEKGIRLAASVLFKNTVKRRWDDEESPEFPVAASEKSLVRSQLVPCMIHLSSSPTFKSLRLQIASVIATIAALDFPTQWPDLITSLVASLHPTNHLVNNAILETAHSIFAPWRSEIRSDSLYSLINLVNSQFLEPFLAMFNSTATALIASSSNGGNPDPDMAKTLALLLGLFYDLTAQDLPPPIEDAHDTFFNPNSGIFVTFLNWNPPSLTKLDDDEGDRSIPNEIKTRIMEILELYVNRFPELVTAEGSLDPFVRAVWSLTSTSSSSSPGSLPSLDATSSTSLSVEAVISQSLRFLATSIKSGHFNSLYTTPATISRLLEDVIVPNVYLREREIEQFEDDPLEYIRADLSSNLSGSAGSSIGGAEGGGVARRQASAEVLKAFVGANADVTTSLAVGWIGKGLEAYAKGGEDVWKHKDAAVYLFSAVAARGWTGQQGVTSTNPLVNVVDFFRDQVYQDLQPASSSHALLAVDAIRFLYSFRNQLTKEQLLSVLPLLIQHLASTNYVCYTYAAIAIERILGMRKDGLMLFGQADIHDFTTDILTGLFVKIESAGNTPEKVAENDYLMKCIMRVVVTSRQSLLPIHEAMLAKLIGILALISKNPSNPLFDQYCFESISALVRFVVANHPETLPKFESSLMGPFQFILQQDIEQYVPYVFQILAQLLELQPANAPTPDSYLSLLPILTTPDVWKQKGSIPGLVRLLKAFLRRDSASVISTGQLTPILGVLQQRLIPSKLNDGWGFDLLEAIVAFVPTNVLSQYYKSILSMLLQRMQGTPTEKFSYSLARFFCYTLALRKDGDAEWSPDFVVATVSAIQPQPPLWTMILQHILLPEIPKSIPKDRKLLAVGLTRLLTGSSLMLQPHLVQNWPVTFAVLEALFKSGEAITKKASTEDQNDALLSTIDQEEQSAGYQAAYSKLAASETAQTDPVEYVTDARRFFAEELQKALNSEPGLKKVVLGIGNSQLLHDLRGAGFAV